MNSERLRGHVESPAVQAVRSGRWHGAARILIRVIAHPAAFWVVVAFFAVQAMLLALSAKSGLYDESYHLGIIRQYVDQLSPFLHNVPSSAGLGDVERMGSLLYYYLLSFPARALDAVGAGPVVYLVVLRGITVVLHVASLIWYRKALKELGVSSAVINIALLVYISLPITTLVAATVNYDNLLQLLSAIFFWLLVRIMSKQRLAPELVLVLVLVGMLASLTKYTFLPVFLGAAIAVAVRQFVVGRRVFRLGGARGLRPDSLRALIPLAVVVVGIGYFFVERYVVNLLDYGSPAPSCDANHSDAYCATYAPWARNVEMDAAHADGQRGITSAIAFFGQQWLGTLLLWMRIVGVGTQTATGADISGNLLSGGFPICLALLALGAAFVVKKPAVLALAGAFVIYAASLFWLNYTTYMDFGAPVATQGRYFISFLPLIIAAAGASLAKILNSLFRDPAIAKIVVVIVLILALTQGGGISTFLSAASDDWFLPGNPVERILPSLRHFATWVILPTASPGA